jgi:hypothetical protein
MFINPSFWSFKHQPLVTVAFEYCLIVHVHSPPWPMHKDKYQLSKCSGHQRQVLKGPLTKLTIVHISNIKKNKTLIILYVWIQWCNKTTQILLTPPPLVGRGYRLSHFWLAKEVSIEVKKKLPLIYMKNLNTWQLCGFVLPFYKVYFAFS